MVLLKKRGSKVLRYFRSHSTADAPADPRLPLADCLVRPASRCCSSPDSCRSASAACCSRLAPAGSCPAPADCCPSAEECYSLLCPYSVGFTEPPPSLLNLLLGYPFNNRGFLHPLTTNRKSTRHSQYHHQVDSYLPDVQQYSHSHSICIHIDGRGTSDIKHLRRS